MKFPNSGNEQGQFFLAEIWRAQRRILSRKTLRDLCGSARNLFL